MIDKDTKMAQYDHGSSSQSSGTVAEKVTVTRERERHKL
jgi:hypothetical protein